MEPLVNYRLLSDQLTQTEFVSFLQQTVITLNTREIFTKSLYDKFQQHQMVSSPLPTSLRISYVIEKNLLPQYQLHQHPLFKFHHH